MFPLRLDCDEIHNIFSRLLVFSHVHNNIAVLKSRSNKTEPYQLSIFCRKREEPKEHQVSIEIESYSPIESTDV